MEIITVGAGPCGLYASQLLQKQGHAVIVLEEHASVGRPMQCAGLVGKAFVDIFGDKNVINTINGAHIVLGNKKVALERSNVAFVLDRTGFDLSFCEDLNISLENRVANVAQDDKGRFYVKTSSATLKADCIIGADGPASIVRRALAIPNKIKYFIGYQQRIRTPLDHDDMALVDITRPFFSWAIPEGNGIARVGTIGHMDVIESMKSKFNLSGEVLETTRAPIPIGKATLAQNNAFLVGDAGAQTKPLTGGGLYYGLCGAKLLAQAIEENKPENYQRYWNREFGKEIQFGLAARKIYENMSCKDLETIFDIICENKSKIEKDGNFDMHSTVFKIILSKPRLFAVLGKSVKNILFEMKK
ncbi:MAG: FAD-dependent monooxygenase [Candidatus Methanofastidiosia archaeon]